MQRAFFPLSLFTISISPRMSVGIFQEDVGIRLDITRGDVSAGRVKYYFV